MLTLSLASTVAPVDSSSSDTLLPLPLRVGTSGDYSPFSDRQRAAGLDGFDIAIARAYAEDRGRELKFVTFRWPKLLRDLQTGKFDVAMSGVTIRPARTVAGRFTVPVVETGAVLLVDEGSEWLHAVDADQPNVRIGVNAGGHLEQVAYEHFPRAILVVIPDNRAVLHALAAYTVDAIITDSLEAPHWLAEVSGFKALGPFTRDRKAYLVRAQQPDLAADLDRWLIASERDGTLARLRDRYLGMPPDTNEPPTAPLRALLAAMDERLSIMPIVAAFKRRNGLPLEVPAREKTVLDAAVAGVHRAAQERLVKAPPDAAVRSLFRAQMEAAKQVQWISLKNDDIDAEEPLPDLEGALRPAILRLGERIADLILDLPNDLEAAAVGQRVRAELRTKRLSNESRTAIATALVELSRAERQGTARSPNE